MMVMTARTWRPSNRLIKTSGALFVASLMGVLLMAQNASASVSDRHCAVESLDPFSLYGDELRFRVLRNGAPIGHHEVRFRTRQDEVIADSRFEAEVRVLFFTAYRYLYQSRDVWRDGCLVAVKAETNDNGKEMRVEAALEGEALRVTSPAGTRTVEAGIFPTTHWNAGVIGSQRVLNTITGDIAAVDMIALGEETVLVEGTPALAQRYRYTGEIQSDVWYDADGRWVKMRFNAQDGSTIEYVCERCGGAAGGA
jgi:hypothetical protein